MLNVIDDLVYPNNDLVMVMEWLLSSSKSVGSIPAIKSSLAHLRRVVEVVFIFGQSFLSKNNAMLKC
jgi:hypothetical protein